MVKILKPGFYSSIQDLGRFGFQEFGVPYAGVMDKKAATLANTLLGNAENEAVLEMTMTGATLQFQVDTCIAISGADMSPNLNENPIKLNKMVLVKANDVLSFGKLNHGFRCYLAAIGGFKTEMVMNSRSMYQNITKQVMLQKNDELQVSASIGPNKKHFASIKFDSGYIDFNAIDVFKGPEFGFLSKIQQNELFLKSFTISKDNNRMAYQLEEPLKNDLKPIITSAVLPGTVQLTPSGKLIILMGDCQTTGGYPRVLQLKESALNVLAQKYTGQKMSFNLNSYV
tara:strand:+ start:8999 stop:9853 length:855 start_codon:yes stop_codon:yes gene_type:complete